MSNSKTGHLCIDSGGRGESKRDAKQFKRDFKPPFMRSKKTYLETIKTGCSFTKKDFLRQGINYCFLAIHTQVPRGF